MDPCPVSAMAFDERGKLVADLQNAREDFHSATGVAEHAGRLFLASAKLPALLAFDLKQHSTNHHAAQPWNARLSHADRSPR